MSLHKTKKHQIEIALEMLMDSMIIVYGYLKTNGHALTVQDMKMLDLFADELARHNCSTSFISLYLHKHGMGKAVTTPVH